MCPTISARALLETQKFIQKLLPTFLLQIIPGVLWVVLPEFSHRFFRESNWTRVSRGISSGVPFKIFLQMFLEFLQNIFKDYFTMVILWTFVGFFNKFSRDSTEVHKDSLGISYPLQKFNSKESFILPHRDNLRIGMLLHFFLRNTFRNDAMFE